MATPLRSLVETRRNLSSQISPYFGGPLSQFRRKSWATFGGVHEGGTVNTAAPFAFPLIAKSIAGNTIRGVVARPISRGAVWRGSFFKNSDFSVKFPRVTFLQVETRPELSCPSPRTKGHSAPLINTSHRPLRKQILRVLWKRSRGIPILPSAHSTGKWYTLCVFQRRWKY